MMNAYRPINTRDLAVLVLARTGLGSTPPIYARSRGHERKRRRSTVLCPVTQIYHRSQRFEQSFTLIFILQPEAYLISLLLS